MRIEVLGTGCPKCEKTLANAKKAVEELGLEAEVVKVYDLGEITAWGVLLTPALAVEPPDSFAPKPRPPGGLQREGRRRSDALAGRLSAREDKLAPDDRL